MSLHPNPFSKCPKCGKKGIHMNDEGHARCKYCFRTFSWRDIIEAIK
jgi:uncharacterized Zn-finger protein